MLVQSDCPARENGAIPLALNLGTRSMMSPHDCGGSAPTWAKIFLFQYRTIGATVSIGTAYSLPSTVAAPNADGNRPSFRSGFSANQLVRSTTWSAST